MSENKNKKTSKRVLFTRILCLVLALIMIGSVCYLAIQLILDSMRENKERERLDRTELTSLYSFDNINGDYYEQS